MKKTLSKALKVATGTAVSKSSLSVYAKYPGTTAKTDLLFRTKGRFYTSTTSDLSVPEASELVADQLPGSSAVYSDS